MRRPNRFSAALLLGGSACVMACAPLPPGGAGSGTAGVGGYGEERVLVGSLAVVEQVAVSRRYVFAAGPGGVAVYDRLSERFVPPATRDLDRELGRDGAFAGGSAPISATAGDPFEDALWIGVPGGVLTYRPLTGQVQRTIVTGVPQRFAFDRSASGDAFVLSGGQWTRVSRVGIATPASPPVAAQVIAPPTFGELLGRYPTLRAQPQLLLRAQQPNRPRSQFALLAGAASPDRASELWLGTDGDGLFRLDPVFGEGTALPYGLLDPGAGALAPAANGVWVAGLGLSARRGGLTFVTFDLQRWRWIEGTIAVPLAGVRTFAVVTRGAQAYLGTDRGLVRVQLDGVQDMQAYTRMRGLPDDRVFALAPREGGVWAGTARGLVFVSDSLAAAGEAVLADLPVYALQQTGSTLWVGTARGLMRLPADAGGLRATVADAPRAAATNEPALRAPVRALSATDSMLLVATDDAVLQCDGRTAASLSCARVPAFDVPIVGDITRVAADEWAFAVAGRDGVTMVSRRTGARRALRVPVDVPGPVLDVLLQRDFVFLATPQGLLRYRRTADGLVP